MFVKRDDAFLLTLTENARGSLPQVDVRDVDPDQFADAYPRRVKEFQYRPVASAQRRVSIRRFDETNGVLRREMIRQLPFDLRRRDHLRRVRLDLSLAYEELKKRPQGSELPRDRGLLLSRQVQACHPLTNR